MAMRRFLVLPRCFRRSSRSASTCRVGCASAFWGDTAVATDQLVRHGKLDFLVYDYLSEITMTLLKGAQAKQPEMGYAPDFVDTLARSLKLVKEQGLRVVSNAGGVNPEACRAALEAAAVKAGVHLDVATVLGDDVRPLRKQLGEVTDMRTGRPLRLDSAISMNAYLGAVPIARCLDAGAEVVITGRCADSAVVLGPLMHQHQWSVHDYDKLAAGSLAGHLVECGAQSTGGIFTDHHLVPDWWNMGFPVVEVDRSGDFVLSKPAGTGGLVTVPTVAEQLLYEIDDPARYRLPDVDCDFRGVRLQDLGGDRVRVTGARGHAPSGRLKVFLTSPGRFRLTAVAAMVGRDCAGKGHRTAEAILTRVRLILRRLGLPDFARVHVQMLGCEETYGPHARHAAAGTREAVLWLAAEHEDKRALGVLAREIAPAGTGMAPGLTGLVGGRPKISQMANHASFLVDQNLLTVQTVTKHGVETVAPVPPVPGPAVEDTPETEVGGECGLAPGDYPLHELAYARSGDKGDTANIGVIARSPDLFPVLKRELTAEVVGEYFKHLFPDGDASGRVVRYELTGVSALNFVCSDVLGGGGVASLRPDPQGKGMGQMLLDLTVRVR